MKAPKFWNSRNKWTIILSPVAKHYGKIVQRKLDRRPAYISKLPVICVGNVTMGGSGKTPVVDAIVDILKEHGKSPAVLMRGYGGKEKGPLWIAPEMDAIDCGDEALLHVLHAPTIISRDRTIGANEIEKKSELTHIVMDDGLQNPSLQKTISILVMDGPNPVGNGFVFPAGPLRETIEHAIRRVNAVVILGEDRLRLAEQLQFLMPVFKGQLQAVNGAQFAGKPVIAFAGIGNPKKFYTSLAQNDAVIIKTYDFADHHLYTEADIQPMINEAKRVGAKLVTTRKDWVRLSLAQQKDIDVLDVAIQWEDKQKLEEFLI